MAERPIEELTKTVRDQIEKARSAVEHGNLDYAIDLLLAILSQEPRVLNVRRLLRAAQVRRYLARGAPTSLRHSVASATGLVTMLKAQAALSKKPLEALRLSERLMSIDPFNPSFYNLLVKAAENAELPEVAVQALETAREITPDDIPLLRKMANLYRAANDTTKMRDCYERVQQLLPNDPAALKDLKDAQATDTMSKGRWTEAQSFRDVIKDSDEAKSLEQQSRAMKTAADLEGLIDEQRAKIAREPQNVNYRRSLSDLLARANRFDEALTALAEADKLAGGGDPQIDRLRTTIRTRKFEAEIAARREIGDAPAADALEQEKNAFLFKDAEERVRRYPNDLQFKFEYGVMLFDRDQPNEAIHMFQLAQRNPQRRVRALWYLARCFEKKGQFDIAAEQLEKAAEEMLVMDQTKKDVLYELGMVNEQMGRNEKALEYYKEIYSSDIGYRDVSKKIEQFYKK